MEAAKGDPLRAQEIEERISEEWWMRFIVNRAALVKAIKAKADGEQR